MKHFIITTVLFVNMGLLGGCAISGQKSAAGMANISCCNSCTCCKEGKCTENGRKGACKGKPCDCCKDNCCNGNECSRESTS